MYPCAPTVRCSLPQGRRPAARAWFEQAGIKSITDLIEYFPFRYEFDTGLVDIADLQPRTTATVRGTVLYTHGRGPYGSYTAEIDDGTQTCTLRWFQSKYVPRGLCVGALVIASGDVQEFNDRLEIVQRASRYSRRTRRSKSRGAALEWWACTARPGSSPRAWCSGRSRRRFPRRSFRWKSSCPRTF
jgi:RecG-like helicase